MPRTRKPRVVTKSYATAPKTQKLIDLLNPLKTEYDNLIKIELNKPGGGSLKDFPSWEEFLRKKLNRTAAEVKTLTGVADYHGLRPTVNLIDARKQLLAKLIELDNKKPGTPAANYTLAEQAGYKPKIMLGKKQGSTAPPGSFKKLLSTQQKVLNRVDDVIKNFENLPVDEIKREGGIYRYIGKPFGYTTLEGVQAHMRKFPKKYETARIDFERLQNPGILNKYSERGMNARDLLAAFEAGKAGPQFSRVLQKGQVAKIMEYANLHLDQGGTLITKLDDNSFIYKNKIFSMKPSLVSKRALEKFGLQDAKIIDLVAEAHIQPEFTEIYKVFDELKEIEKIKRPHPLTGKMTPLVTLIKAADDIAYPRRKDAWTKSGLAFDHPKSVKAEPFEIRVATRAMNEGAGTFAKGVAILDPKFGKKAMGYSFKGNILPSVYKYIDNTITKGVARTPKMLAAQTKAIDEALAAAGKATTKGGQFLIPEIEKGTFLKDKGKAVSKLEKQYTQVKTTAGYRPPSVNEPRISVAQNYQRILVDQLSKLKKGSPAYIKACGIGTKIMSSLKAAGGRVGYKAAGVVGSCPIIPALEAAPEQTMNELSKLKSQTGVLGRIGNTAKGFLGALGKWGPKIGKYGAIAAAGAIAQPLVKQFMNDDPSTYLTDPDQQAGMLEALIEGEQPKPRSEILDWGTTAGAVGATAAAVPGSGAMYKYRRGLSEAKIPKAGPITEAGLTAGDYLSKHAGKDYGKIRAGAGVGMKLLSGMFTPAGLLATEPFRIAQKRREGESWGDIATDPFTWMGPAFAPSMTRIATAGMKRGSLLPKLLRLGISSSRLAAMGPAGWAALVASLGWEGMKQYSDYKKHRGFFASEDRLGT